MLAFIGGTGLTRMDNLRIVDKHAITTRFGEPSAPFLEPVDASDLQLAGRFHTGSR